MSKIGLSIGVHLNPKERKIIAVLLALIAAMVAFDIYTDFADGVAIWHVLVEGSIGVAALAGIFYILQGSFELRHRLNDKQKEVEGLKAEAEQWQKESKKYIDGLSLAIDQQLNKWKLTGAEKEVAFLLLKGLSLKEVADIRQTSEKTARVQSIAIYAKSGLAGRSELSAFFLEDLLAPSNQNFENKKTID